MEAASNGVASTSTGWVDPSNDVSSNGKNEQHGVTVPVRQYASYGRDGGSLDFQLVDRYGDAMLHCLPTL